MSAIVEYLFPAPARRSAAGIAAWWEARRLGYNVIVGLVGLVSFGWTHLMLALPPTRAGAEIPVAGVIVFGVLANVFYTTGPIVEYAVERLSRGRVLPLGPMLYRMGLTFSVGLALMPAAVSCLDWGIRILKFIIG